MKLFLVMFFTVSFYAFADTSYSQDAKVSVNMEKALIKDVLHEIENASEFYFVYNNQLVDVNRRVNVDAQEQRIVDVLNEIFINEEVEYTVLGHQIVLSPGDMAQDPLQDDAEDIQLTGTVVDDADEPVPGATVTIEGTSVGTITDADGNFSFSAPVDAENIVISFVGMESAHIAIGDETEFYVTLQDAALDLEEVVVVGYGTQQRENLTGSVATVDQDMLENRPMSSISAGLSGLAPGVHVQQGSGMPGADGGTIRIRGTGTLNNASPLVIVDGVESSMDEISPQDIESVSVLKDAASAAIYGSKAANGVILITTKSGEDGEPVVRYSGDFGWQSPVDLPEYLNSADYARLYNRALQGEGRDSRFTDEDIRLFESGESPYTHPDTDWLDLLYDGSGFQTSHNFSISGGSEYSTYRMSVDYQNQDGIIEHVGKERYNVRTNISSDPYEWLTANLNLSYTKQDLTRPNNAYVGGGVDQIIRQAYRISPWIPYKNEDGTYGTISDGNPIAWLDQGKQIKMQQDNFLGIGSLQFHLTDDLSVKGTASIRTSKNDNSDMNREIQYNESRYHGPTSLQQVYSESERVTGDIIANYSKSFDQHNFDVMAGYHAEKFNYKYTRAYRENFPSPLLEDLNAGATRGQQGGGYSRELNMESYFGRVNYNYDSRYLFEANLRYDASSRFHEDNRWGAFPSFSAGWRISEESFMSNTRSVLDNLTIRASYGMLGNQDALNAYYPTVPTLALGMDYPFNSEITSGAAITEAKNQNLEWEKTTSWGLGFDATMFNRLNVTFDYYNRKTTDIIMEVPSPETFALTGFYDNVGEMSNEGIEMSLQYQNSFGEIDYSVGGHFSYNVNELLQLAGQNQLIQGRTIRRIGEPLDSFYGYKTDGLYQSESEIDEWPENTLFNRSDLKPGDLRYVDVTGDDKVTSDDRTILGNSTPDFTYGFNIGGEFRNFDLQALFEGTRGGHGYMDGPAIGDFSGDSSKPTVLWEDSWTPENSNSSVPRIQEGPEGPSMPDPNTTAYWLHSTDYLRLKNLQIGYTLPDHILNNWGISRARIYYSGQNLLTFTDYLKGWDPEVPSGRGSGYPVVMVNSFGINVTF
ncbi:TonB-dependent receptor [Marinilabiliaceae bacterium ANBcel2]|nr:TonB-dependent receptor [Marinilabiliaceae bacterium ANBcel2]